MSGAAPVLETARLRLRGFRVTDFESTAALWGDAEVTQFIGGKPSTREEAWARLLRNAGYWTLLGFGMWVVEEKDTGAYAGEIGFLDAKRAIVPPLDGMPEVGWVMSPRLHGKGYATEAVKAALAWGDGHFGKVTMVCIIAPENRPSIRVAEKTGFRVWQTTAYHDNPTVLLRREPS